MRREDVEGLLLIPRVVFYPLHLILRYGIRVPVGWLLREMDRSGLGATTPNPPSADPDAWDWGLSPHVRYDLGFVPSAGLAFFLDERAGTAQFRVGADTWGSDRLGGWLFLESRGGDLEGGLGVRGDWRIDRIFHGFGWDSAAADQMRYARGHLTSRVWLRHRIWRGSSIEAGARVSFQRFEPSGYGGGDLEPIAAQLRSVPGFEGFTAAGPSARLRFDTRASEEERFATGVGLTIGGAWNVDAERGTGASWARLDTDVDLAWEITTDRTLSLRGTVQLVEPVGTDPIPFTEQVGFGGGLAPLPGFLEGRLTGESGTALGIVYRYSVWAWLDASVFVDVGNVFGRGFEDFDATRLRLSAGFALQSSEARFFTLLFAMGTEPFALGADITSARVAIGFGTSP